MNLVSAKNAQEFCLVTERDEEGRAVTVVVPGHKCRRYQVDISRTKARYTCRCREVDGEVCKGNQFGKVCYHSLAAILQAIEGRGHIAFFERRELPASLVGFGGRLLEVCSGDGQGRLWALLHIWRRKRSRVKVQKKVAEVAEDKPASLFPGAGPYAEKY